MRPVSADLFTVRGGPAVLAHRGTGPGVGVQGLQENSLGALLRAVDDGAHWLECDVQLSGDGDLVLAHDVLHDGRAVRDCRTAELRRRGLVVLDEVHRWVPAHVGLDLDVKITLADRLGSDGDLFAAVTAWAREARRTRPVLVSSFCPSLLAGGAAGVPLGWITNRTSWFHESVVSAVRMGAAAVAVHAGDVLDVSPGCPPAEEVAEFARRRDLAVLAWGVEPTDVAELARRGVTGLCTDHVPAVAAGVAGLRAPVAV